MLIELLAIFGIKGIGHQLNKLSYHTADKDGVYLDGNGDYRLESNKRKVVREKDYKGDLVIRDAKDKTVYKNITKENAIEAEKEAIKRKKKFFLRQPAQSPYDNKIGDPRIQGDRYCEVGKDMDDLENMYVIRNICYRDELNQTYYGNYYMNLHHKLYTPTEETIYDDEWYYRNLDIDIAELYNTVIELWNSDHFKKANNDMLYFIGKPNKNDYKEYTDRISRW